MVGAAFLITASLCAATGKADVAATPPDRAGQALQAWNQRAESIASGTVPWVIEDDKFGRFESSWYPTDPKADVELDGELRFSRSDFQYSSRSFEYPEFGFNMAKGTTEREFYRSALLSKFPDPAAEHREPLSYLTTMTTDSCTHSWHGGESEYPRSLVLPTNSLRQLAALAKATAYNSDSADNLSGVPSPVLHQLLTLPLIWAFRPSLFDARMTGASTDVAIEVDAAIPGQHVWIMQLPSDATEEDSLAWKFFLTPDQGFSIRRAIGYLEDRAVTQIDISYDQYEEQIWLPKKWTVLTLGSAPATVTQVVTAVRSEMELQDQASADIEFAKSIPVEAWVNDLVAGRQYLATETGDFEINAIHSATLTYPQVLALSRGEEIVPRVEKWKNSARRQLVVLVRWPGILLPLGLIGACMFLAIRFTGPKRKEPKSDE